MIFSRLLSVHLLDTHLPINLPWDYTLDMNKANLHLAEIYGKCRQIFKQWFSKGTIALYLGMPSQAFPCPGGYFVQVEQNPGRVTPVNRRNIKTIQDIKNRE